MLWKMVTNDLKYSVCNLLEYTSVFARFGSLTANHVYTFQIFRPFSKAETSFFRCFLYFPGRPLASTDFGAA